MGKDKKTKPVEGEVIIPTKKPNVEGRIYKLKILMGKTFDQITYGVYKKELEELEKSLKG